MQVCLTLKKATIPNKSTGIKLLFSVSDLDEVSCESYLLWLNCSQVHLLISVSSLSAIFRLFSKPSSIIFSLNWNAWSLKSKSSDSQKTITMNECINQLYTYPNRYSFF